MTASSRRRRSSFEVLDALGALPGVVTVAAVAGTGMVAVVATALGLMPLYGEPEAGLDGWRDVAPDLLASVAESLRIALPATVLAASAGLGLAALLLRDGRCAGLVRTSCLVVLSVPHLVGATSVGLLLGDGGLGARLLPGDGAAWPPLVGGSLPVATVLELAWKESAFVALVVVAAVAPGHRLRMEVAAGLGAGPRHRFARVLVPTAIPALLVSSLVVTVYAVGSYEVAWLLGRAAPEPLPVLAVRLFGSIELSDRPAAATAALTATVLACLLAAPALAALPRLRSVVVPPGRP